MGDFIRAMHKEQIEVLNDFRQVDLREHHSKVPIFLWIADDRVAVFSVPNYAPGAHETGFRTRDPKLIRELKGVFDTYVKESSKYVQ